MAAEDLGVALPASAVGGELLSPLFPGGVSAAHRELVTTWWCEVFGGAAEYTERLGGYPAMLARFRLADEPGRLPGVGHPAGHAQLPAWRRCRGAGPGAPLGLGVAPPYQP